MFDQETFPDRTIRVTVVKQESTKPLILVESELNVLITLGALNFWRDP